ncbi:MAG: 2-C-methyl-D-erythritol 2,4-cyclodiphosphate synthase [Bacteroidia bacterium]
MKSFRIGLGYDIHKLTPGRPLVLGGVSVPYEKGLEGHSDADVLLHALCDALLGALALGDIGSHFPNTDPTYKNISSRLLLAQVTQKVHQLGWQIGNVDSVLIAQEPKIAPYIRQMQATIAQILMCPPENISIKATTPEFLGALGRKEGIAAYVNALIFKP